MNCTDFGVLFPNCRGAFKTLRTIIASLAISVLVGSCGFNKFAASKVGDVLAEGGDVYASDNDIEFVGAAVPFGLKTIESLLETVPRHRGLLLSATRGFTQYAFVYVQIPADEAEDGNVAYAYAQRDRARRLYLRARDYGLRGLGLDEPDRLKKFLSNPKGELQTANRDELPLLYWTGLAWVAAISLSKDDPMTIAGLPAADALISKAAELDIDYDHGTLRTFLIGYETSRPNAPKNAIDLARTHFAKAVELSSGLQAGPYVALAESVSVARRNRAEFESLLKQALAINVDLRPEWRLANLVTQRRAKWLLTRVENLFTE